MYSTLRKYASTLDSSTAGSRTISFLPYKAGLNMFATSGDWTPGTGDFKICKAISGSGLGTENSIGTAPTWVNGRVVLILSGSELTCQYLTIRIENAAINSDEILVETYGHASAQYPGNYVDVAAMGMTNLDAAITSRLAPTVATRTLDVSATGEAGLDFANIKDATGAHTLTNITVPVVSGVTNDVGGKVLGGGAGTIAGVGVWALDDSGNAIAASSDIVTLLAGVNVTTIAGLGYGDAIGGVIDSNLTIAATNTHLTQIKGSGWVIGDNLHSRLDAAVSSRLPTSSYTAQTGDSYARLGAPAGASVSADVAAVKVDTGNLVTRITANLFSGITKLAEWLGLLAGKQTGNSTARTEIRATGAGSGAFDETTDSQEALRDRGDAAWTTGAGGGGGGTTVNEDTTIVSEETEIE